jgi:hypothetical protein
MCAGTDPTYEEFPPVTIGGPTGNYFITSPIVSCRWAEFCVDLIVNGDGGTGAVVISGSVGGGFPPAALDYTGIATNKFSDDAIFKGWPIRVPATSTTMINSSWERITNSQKRIHVRIDAAASTSLYLTLRFRVKVLERLPGPSHEVHPDYWENMNKAREHMTTQRLKDMGIPGFAAEEEEGQLTKVTTTKGPGNARRDK